jgi:hypothetical protein
MNRGLVVAHMGCADSLMKYESALEIYPFRRPTMTLALPQFAA